MTSPADRLYRERFITQTVGNVTTTGHGARTEIKLVLGDAGDERNYSYRKWLAPWLYKDWKGSQAQRLSNLCQRATAGTGGWLIDKALPDLLGGEADNLCLHGRVGSGKSTLCALAVQANRVSAKVSSSQWNGLLVPALFAFDLEYTHNSEFLLRTIMAQFCTLQNIPSDIVAERKTGVDPSAIPDILDLTTSIIKQLDEQAETRNCQRDDGEGNSAKSIPVTLVLDALDELPARTQRAVWNIFDHLSTLNRTLRHIRIRIILFVRTDSLIHDYYANNRGWAMHAISKTRVNADIRTTVTGRLADQPSLRFMNPTDRKQVVDAIADRVDGMFRLAALYCDEIDRLQRSTTTANEVLNLVSTLPNQLYDFYDRILERVTDRKLQKYIVRTLWFLRVDGRNIDERVPVTLSIISYQSWYSWFIKMVDDPVSSDDILKPLNGLHLGKHSATLDGNFHAIRV
ncbi:hypothetical protein EJ04DRAFT_571362 [Polyplosphaeria fusca]|uniref:Nephrocystin 3-like N-terminal domain-containing protein n=1 Tax=Polyplosphaeria fusca TaxID=682080 RepID=A0A9P4RCT1_9PLEO|nr:hypothetical protein EJ04DRAFT_571362 [Polyplosphaeria fusca]